MTMITRSVSNALIPNVNVPVNSSSDRGNNMREQHLEENRVDGLIFIVHKY